MRIITIPLKENFYENPYDYSLFGAAEYFLFQYQYDFYLIIYKSNSGFDTDLKEQFLKLFVQKNFNTPYDINRGMDYQKLKNIIKEGKVFKHSVYEVCYDYSNNFKGYCFARKVKFTDLVKNSELYLTNCENAINEISKSDTIDYRIKENLIHQIKQLFHFNNPKTSEYESVTLTNLLSKEFIKTIKNLTT